MKYIFYISFFLIGIVAKAQLPSNTFISRNFTGNTKAQWILLDSPLVNFVGASLFNARYAGTQFVKIGGGDTAFYFGAGGNLWFRSLLDRDTVSLSNRINLKLNITDTTNKWWNIGKRWVDTVYRVNDSTIGFTINNGAQQTFEIKGGASGGGGGSGTVTSVALSMPSAFSVSGSPITSSGTFSVSGAGTSAQYIRGNGTLATFDTTAIPNFYLKARGLLSGTSPITYNTTTGAIGINNASTSGAKGAATFTSAFSDNGLGTIDLANVTSAGTCINCDITFDAKGRTISYASGTPPDFVNAPGAGDTLSRSDTLKRLNNGYGILHTVTANNITHSVDTSSSNSLVTQYDLSQIVLGINQLTGDVTAGPGSGSQAATISTNVVTNAKIRQSVGLSVIGRASSSTGNVADITASTANTFLGYNGTSLDFRDPLLAFNTTNIAYVDANGNNGTGVVGNPTKPYLTINAALDATAALSSCIIKIGLGTFNSPDSAKMRSNIWFQGSGMPVTNDTVTVNAFYNNTSIKVPTKLIGGTILRGTFAIPYNREHVHVTDLGVDVGSDWVTNVNSGTEVDGLICAQYFNNAGGLPSADGKHLLQTGTSPRRGMLFKNISVLLSSSSSLFHCFLVENTINPVVDNIHTSLGFAGIVIKTIGGRYSNLYTRGHGTYHIICKSNDYSHCYGVVITNFECNSVGTGYQGTGVTFDQGDVGSPGVYWITMTNGFINHVGAGLSITGDGMALSNINIETISNTGVISTGMIRSVVNNVHTRYCVNDGFNINSGSVIADGSTSWNNCTAIGNGGIGVNHHSGSSINYFEAITCVDNVGYAFNTAGTSILGHHDFYNNTAGSINGTVIVANNDVVNGKTGKTSFTAYGVVAGGTTSTGALQQVSGTGTAGQLLTSNGAGALPTWQNSASITTLYTGDGTLAGNRIVTGNSNSLTFTGMFNYRVDANAFILAKSTPGLTYTTAVLGTDNRYEIGYTPTPTVYSKGAGITIDTNNNVSLGTAQILSTHPLYGTGSAFANGFTSALSNFYRVDNISANQTLGLSHYWIEVDASGGAITITLPAASTSFGSNTGVQYVIRKTDATGNVVTISRAGSDTINGATTATLTAQYNVKEIQCVSTSAWAIKSAF